MKTSFKVLLPVVLLLILPAAVHAQFNFTTNAHNTITITGYTGPGGDVVIPDMTNGLSVTYVGNMAFYQRTNISSLTIGTNVSTIQSGAFVLCSGVTNVTIPNSVQFIGSGAFWLCTSLPSVAIGPNVHTIEPQAFSHCDSLTAIAVDAANAQYRSVAGVLFNKTQTSLLQCPGALAGAYAIPSGVTNVGQDAFEGCAGLTNILVPDSVLSIWTSAFYLCTNLTGVYFKGNAPSVSLNAFGEDNQATAYYLPRTAGWDLWVSPPPAVLWNPTIQTSDGGFGVQNNQFGFTIVGTPDIPIAVAACSDPANSSWTALQTCTLTNGSIYFSDPDWANYPTRFYRIRSP
jgi:hypothetical protein